jgi:hypothetical protein
MRSFEEQKSIVSRLNVIDDVFFQKMVEDKEVAEEILRIILHKPRLKVIKNEVQRALRNTGAHSVVLDLLCEDEDHSLINVEVQKKNDSDHQKRVRFNRSNIDTIFVEKGLDYNELPDVFMVFISSFDIFGENRTIYHINRVIEETGTFVNNGTHEIYVNTAVDDKSDIAELMQYFKRSVGDHGNFKKLCGRVKYFKESQKGVSDMCQVVEDYATEKAIQIAINLLKNGASIDLVADSIPSLTRDYIVELSQKIEDEKN